ncbi:MAG: M13 family metallopeptidase [Candidatus Stygibacter australis]|nr:M13 family metallopeptidase [Candidatus Stygibacter australis]MDP8321784.1 M13 family metallopeptidase [Candidatus Stygibacter australis]
MKNVIIILILFAGCILSAQAFNSIDYSIIDTSFDPGDDFYRYASGMWLKNNSLPENRSRFGFFDLAENQTNSELISLMQKKNDDPLQTLISTFFTSGMDSISIELAGISALEPQMKIIQNISTNTDLTIALAYLQLIGVNPLFEIYSPIYWELRGTHYLYLQRSSNILPVDPDLEISQKLAQDIPPPPSNYNLYSIKKLQRTFSNIQWEEYFKILQIKEKKAVIAQPAYFELINDLLAEYSLEEWKTYLQWILLQYATKITESHPDQNLFVMQTIASCLPNLTGHLYTQNYFSSESRNEVHNIITNLQTAFKNRIADKDWLSSATKKKIEEKIDNFTFKIGEPDFYGSDYDNLQIDEYNFMQNVFNSCKFNTLLKLQNCGEIVKKEEWVVPAHSTNAWYSANKNDITLTAAYINQLFSPLNDQATNYAMLGPSIAHEMTHSLDDTGRLYNADGKYKKWWKKSEIRHFNELTQKLIEQSENYIIIDTLHINGKRSAGENIADAGGLNIAWDAYNIATENDTPAIIKGFTPEQRFFLAYAQKWRDILSDELKRSYAAGYYHAPPEYRTNGNVYNIHDFYKAFNISSGRLYKKEKDRIIIW